MVYAVIRKSALTISVFVVDINEGAFVSIV